MQTLEATEKSVSAKGVDAAALGLKSAAKDTQAITNVTTPKTFIPKKAVLEPTTPAFTAERATAPITQDPIKKVLTTYTPTRQATPKHSSPKRSDLKQVDQKRTAPAETLLRPGPVV